MNATGRTQIYRGYQRMTMFHTRFTPGPLGQSHHIDNRTLFSLCGHDAQDWSLFGHGNAECAQCREIMEKRTAVAERDRRDA